MFVWHVFGPGMFRQIPITDRLTDRLRLPGTVNRKSVLLCNRSIDVFSVVVKDVTPDDGKHCTRIVRAASHRRATMLHNPIELAECVNRQPSCSDNIKVPLAHKTIQSNSVRVLSHRENSANKHSSGCAYITTQFPRALHNKLNFSLYICGQRRCVYFETNN